MPDAPGVPAQPAAGATVAGVEEVGPEQREFVSRVTTALAALERDRAWLARRTGLSYDRLGRVLRCEHAIKLDEAAAIARAIGLSVRLPLVK